MTRSPRPLTLSLAAASIGAGAIHLSVAPQHLRELPALGIAFVLLGVGQAVWGTALLRTASPRVVTVTMALGAGSLLAWGVSRTVGLPLPGEGVEPVGLTDLLCALLEVPVAVGGLVLLRGGGTARSEDPAWTTSTSRPRFALASLVLAMTAVAGTTGIAVAAAPSDHGHAPGATSSARHPEPAGPQTHVH